MIDSPSPPKLDLRTVAPASLLMIIFPFLFPEYVPIWDGRWYFDLLQRAMEAPFDIHNFALSGHTCIFYALIIAGTQWIDFGNVMLIHLVNILFGLLGVVSFERILSIALPRLSSTDRALFTTIFAANPALLASALNPTLDFPATCLGLAMVASLLYERRSAFIFFGIASIFTREVGLSLYLTLAGSYFLATVARKKSWRRSDILSTSILAAPLLVYLTYITHRSLRSAATPLWGAGAGHEFHFGQLFLRFDLNDPYTQTHLAHFFVINFAWVLAGFGAVFLLLWQGPKLVGWILDRESPTRITPIPANWMALAVIGTMLVVNMMVLVNYHTFTNIRYRLPLMPYVLLFEAWCFSSLFQASDRVRQTILGLLIALMLVANFRTLDPVSIALMGTVDFGEHEILCMTSLTKEVDDCGRDQRTYNSQFTQFVPLLNMAVAEMELHDGVAIASHFQTHFFTLSTIDRERKEITLRQGENVVRPWLISFQRSRAHMPTSMLPEIADADLPFTLYYLSVPDWSQPELEAAMLHSRGYREVEVKDIHHDGYYLLLVKLTRDMPAATTRNE